MSGDISDILEESTRTKLRVREIRNGVTLETDKIRRKARHFIHNYHNYNLYWIGRIIAFIVLILITCSIWTWLIYLFFTE